MYPWEDEKARDQRKFQELYPLLARQIQPLVEEECDRMEYDGSFMFDEYPDKNLIQRQIFKIQDEVGNVSDNTGDPLESRTLQELIEMLLYHEMYRRRQRRRRFQRHFIY